MDCSPPDSSVHGMLQPRILEWVATSFSRGSSQPRDWTCISCIGRQILYHSSPGKPSRWVCWATETSSGVICYGMKYRLSSPRWQLVSGSVAQGLLGWLSSLLLTSISGKQLSSASSLPHWPQPWDFYCLPRVLSITWLLALFSSRMEKPDFLSISHRPVSVSPSQFRCIPELMSQRLAFEPSQGADR